jgi:hypothetical protein
LTYRRILVTIKVTELRHVLSKTEFKDINIKNLAFKETNLRIPPPHFTTNYALWNYLLLAARP